MIKAQVANLRQRGEKPDFFDAVLLRGWINYIFMFCSIPLGILLFRKEKKQDTAEV